MAITFSIDTGHKLDLAQRKKIGELSESFFGQSRDPQQMQVTPKTIKWFMNNFPKGLNQILDDDALVGFSMVFLSDEKTMKKFIEGKINENELSDYFMENFGKKKMDCIYLCAALVIPKYQKRGFATRALVNQITQLGKTYNIKFKNLFYWGYSDAGTRTARKISKTLKMPLYVKNCF